MAESPIRPSFGLVPFGVNLIALYAYRTMSRGKRRPSNFGRFLKVPLWKVLVYSWSCCHFVVVGSVALSSTPSDCVMAVTYDDKDYGLFVCTN